MIFQVRVKEIIWGKIQILLFYNILLHISLTLVSVRCFLIYPPGLSNTNAMLKKHNIEQDLHWEKSKNYAIFIIVGKQERYTDILRDTADLLPDHHNKANSK